MLYTVKYGDSLSSIAEAHHISPADLSLFNQLDPHAKPVIGQAIIIPGKSKPARKIIIHGPVLPVTGETTLLSIAPYLTYASISSARIPAEGNIVFPNASSIVSRAAANGIAPLLTLSNNHESNELCRTALYNLLSSEHAMDTLICHLTSSEYRGVNVDFAGICHEDTSAYASLIHMLGDALHRRNLTLLTTVYKSDNHLYSALSYADCAIILPWEREHISMHPAPICPVDEMRKVLEQVTEIIPGEKILMGMPTLGYNWKLPCHGSLVAVIYPNQAPTLAYNNFADIRYDDTAQASHFSYYDSAGSEHAVWFHDPRSITARLKLVEEYSLGGISWQNTAPLYRPFWACLGEMHGTYKLT